MQDSWDVMYDIINYYGDNKYNLSAYAGSGSWNDPDEVYKTYFIFDEVCPA